MKPPSAYHHHHHHQLACSPLRSSPSIMFLSLLLSSQISIQICLWNPVPHADACGHKQQQIQWSSHKPKALCEAREAFIQTVMSRSKQASKRAAILSQGNHEKTELCSVFLSSSSHFYPSKHFPLPLSVHFTFLPTPPPRPRSTSVLTSFFVKAHSSSSISTSLHLFILLCLPQWGFNEPKGLWRRDVLPRRLMDGL